jgi:putative YphP/YqiW family bacilliredoxin
MYPAEIVIPMKEELTENGFEEMLTAADVDQKITEEGTTLVVINSVCGCSAGTARPGVLLAVHNSQKKPDHLATSFRRLRRRCRKKDQGTSPALSSFLPLHRII